MAGSVLAHLGPLLLLRELVKVLLDLAEHGLKFIHHRLREGAEQPLFVPKAGVD